uniref:Uncharacterized protein LOC114345271 n=1 Tax=Diabrotica virgifera virgifera TaxID=50390 RepID=A0A6P7GQN8_DIAVI
SPLSRAGVSGGPGGGGGGGETTSSASGSPRPRAQTPGTVAGLDLLPLSTSDEVSRRREVALRQHSFFQLRIHLRRGQGLAAMDKNGEFTSFVTKYLKNNCFNVMITSK